MTSSGYKVTAYLPVIPPPPDPASGTAHYAAFGANPILSQSGVDDGVIIEGIPLAHSQVYAMFGGFVSFVPAGQPLPVSTNVAPAGGAVAITIWAADVDAQRRCLAPGLPALSTVIYTGLNPATVKSALRPHVQALTAKQLLTSYKSAHGGAAPASGTDAAEDHLNRVISGSASVFVGGGAILGNGGPVNSTDPAQGARLELRLISALEPNSYAPPLPVLAAAPAFDSTVPKESWQEHPLTLAALALPRAAEFHLRFSVWNPLTSTYDPIANAAVSVIHDTQTGPVALTGGLMGTTDSNGVVHLSTPDLDQATGPMPALHFEIDLQSSNQHYDPATGQFGPFPISAWSTKGWRSANYVVPGDFPAFSGGRMGNAAAPAEFRVGLDFTVKLGWTDPWTAQFLQAPPGLVVDLVINVEGGLQRFTTHADIDGVAAGVVYPSSMAGDAVIALVVKTALCDPTAPASMLATFLALEAHDLPELIQGWNTPPSEIQFPFYEGSRPRPIRPPQGHIYTLDMKTQPQLEGVDRGLFLGEVYVLQCFAELLESLRWLIPNTNIVWNDGEGMKFAVNFSGNTSFTAADLTGPTRRGGTVYNPDRLKAPSRRVTIFHELGHALLGNYCESVFDQNAWQTHGFENHAARLITNELTAFTEGFAEFFAAMFTAPEAIFQLFPPPDGFADVGTPGFHWSRPFNGYDPYGQPLPAELNMDVVYSGEFSGFVAQSFGPPSANKGLVVEGAFATALYMIFNEMVAGGDNSSPRTIKRSNGNGLVASVNPWINAGLGAKFESIIWDALNPFLLPNTLEETSPYVQEMQSNRPSLGHETKSIWNRLNILVTEPVITSIKSNGNLIYSSGAVTGLVQAVDLINITVYLEIAGYDFPSDAKLGLISSPGDLPLGRVSVDGWNLITVRLLPLQVGTYDLFLDTAWGRKVFPGALVIA